MTHTDILKVILKCMGLPETIRNPIEGFQKDIKTTAKQPVVSRGLAIAETYANGLLLVSSESSLIAPITEKDWSALSGQTRLAIPDGEEIRSQVYCLTGILSRMSSADQAGLTKSPYKKSKALIWLARDSYFSTADPLEAALGELANVESHDRLPTPEELTNFSALAVESPRRNAPGVSWRDIENSLKSNPRLPLLWLVNEASAAPSDLAVEQVRAVTLRTIQAFISGAAPAIQRAAA
jgi:hypothetical protein